MFAKPSPQRSGSSSGVNGPAGEFDVATPRHMLSRRRDAREVHVVPPVRLDDAGRPEVARGASPGRLFGHGVGQQLPVYEVPGARHLDVRQAFVGEVLGRVRVVPTVARLYHVRVREVPADDGVGVRRALVSQAPGRFEADRRQEEPPRAGGQDHQRPDDAPPGHRPALHGSERACGPDQVVFRDPGQDHQRLAPADVEVRRLPDRAPPGVVGPVYLRRLVLQLRVDVDVRLADDETAPVSGGDRPRAISRDAAHRQRRLPVPFGSRPARTCRSLRVGGLRPSRTRSPRGISEPVGTPSSVGVIASSASTHTAPTTTTSAATSRGSSPYPGATVRYHPLRPTFAMPPMSLFWAKK